MAQTNVQRRKAGYYYRQKIPADLLTHYGKREIVRSLGTSKKREASASGYKQGHSWTQDFTRIRAGGLQTVPRAIAEAQGLLEALEPYPSSRPGKCLSRRKQRSCFATSTMTSSRRPARPTSMRSTARTSLRLDVRRATSGYFLNSKPTSTEIIPAHLASDGIGSYRK
jgi:hypothetical protein